MLVEDDDNLREIYEARLAAEGYEIVTARNGEDALVVAKEHRPDLIISDVMMPSISGFDMLDILRNTQGLHDAKVIMLTALGQADDKLRAEKLGADRYLVKSQVTLEDIVNTAAELLAGDSTPATPASDPAVAETTPPLAPEPVAAPMADPVQPLVPEPVVPVAEPVVTPEPIVAPTPEPVLTPDPTPPAPELTAAPAPEPVVIPTPVITLDPTSAAVPEPVIAPNAPLAEPPTAPVEPTAPIISMPSSDSSSSDASQTLPPAPVEPTPALEQQPTPVLPLSLIHI